MGSPVMPVSPELQRRKNHQNEKKTTETGTKAKEMEEGPSVKSRRTLKGLKERDTEAPRHTLKTAETARKTH